MGSLPRGIPVEIEVIVEVDNAPARGRRQPAAVPQVGAKAKGDRRRTSAGRAFDRPLSDC